MLPSIESRIADEIGVRPTQVLAAVLLLDEGATVPFITRYRKERTGNLDEVAIRRVLEARDVFARILSRQAIIVESIERHATLTPELRERILATFDLDEALAPAREATARDDAGARRRN